MKRLICVVMILCLLFSLTACIKTPVKLDAPTNVKASRSGLITWDAVANATGYVVEINGQQYTTDQTSFQAPNATSSFNFTVKATADNYEDSDATEATFTYVPSIIIPPDDEKVTVAIVGASEVRSKQSITLKARVNGVVTDAVTWDVTEGSQYIESIEGGVLQAKEVDSDHIIKVKVTSTEHEKASAEKILTVLSKTTLTQAMLDVFNDKNKVAFEGYLNIALYLPGVNGNVLQGTYVSTIQTAMDGENWYAMYDSTGTGVTQGMYIKKLNGLAQQVQVSLMNDEEYYPMKDSNGKNVSWTDSGMYNSFMNLSTDDFKFDEDTWQWTYRWTNTPFINRVLASANPYDFDPTNLTLIIEDGEIMGIHSKSEPSLTVKTGYIAIMDLYVAINYTDTVEIPTISKYVRDNSIHDELEVAINNMRNLKSYKVDFTKNALVYGMSTALQDGFEEIVTEDECYFRGYDIAVKDGELVRNYSDSGYGFRKISNELYNSYNSNSEVGYYASRAYKGNFATAKASFMFAPELFRKYYPDEDAGETTYYVDEIMCQVATTWYCAPGTDMALYGLFATNYWISIYQYEPYVTVKDGYITEAGFFFNMGNMYGNVMIKYSDFDAAELEEDHFENVRFETRQIPTSWSQLDIQMSKQDGETETEISVNAKTWMDEKFGSADSVPFFGSVLGDSYGFGMSTMHRPSSGGRMYSGVIFYYDVPVDMNYTLDSSMVAVKSLLVENGFVANAAGEYCKGNLWVAPTDDDLDLKIYVWQTNS